MLTLFLTFLVTVLIVGKNISPWYRVSRATDCGVRGLAGSNPGLNSYQLSIMHEWSGVVDSHVLYR